MDFIDAQRLAEFLDDNKKTNLNRESLRTDLELLEEAGLMLPPTVRKSRKKIRSLEYFLLRSQLYKPSATELVPNTIKNHWSDYAKSWIMKINGKTIHMPFLGKIAFVCSIGKKKRVICHPESSSIIDKIVVDSGVLTLERSPDRKELRYVRKTCEHILDFHKNHKLKENLETISNSAFGRALLSLGLANISNNKYSLKGSGLLLSEMTKIKTGDKLEKVARLILRREQKKKAQVSSAIVCLEYLERMKHLSKLPIGSSPRYWKSKRTGKKYERLGHYDRVSHACSFDTRTAANILAKSTPYDAYATFGAFLETYYKTSVKGGEDWADTYSFLSWYTDSFAFLDLSNEERNKLNWPNFKKQKTERHKSYLKRFVNDAFFQKTTRKGIKRLPLKSPNTEIIDMNLEPDSISAYDKSEMDYCPSNVYASSNVPVDRALFESTVLNVLQSESKFKDSQGAFYYPDFRFLVASNIGLNLKNVDQILAYVIATGPDLSRRLWFFPAFGKVPRRDRADPKLAETILKPFDSITLNY